MNHMTKLLNSKKYFLLPCKNSPHSRVLIKLCTEPTGFEIPTVNQSTTPTDHPYNQTIITATLVQSQTQPDYILTNVLTEAKRRPEKDVTGIRRYFSATLSWWDCCTSNISPPQTLRPLGTLLFTTHVCA